MKALRFLGVFFLLPLFVFSGCGYTAKTTLPQDIKTIYVNTVQNKIPLEQTYVYTPGLEISITNAMIRRFHQDGNLKIVKKKEADAVLVADLIGFQQEGLRFNNLERVEEYRLYLVLSLKLVSSKTKELLWEEPNFSGDAEYFVSDVRSVGREEGVQRAVDRLARNVVDRIVEDW